MPAPPRPLEHRDTDKKSDEALRQEARAHLADAPALQLVAELYGKLRSLDLPWWTPESLRTRWSATDRMRWYRARPDLRQQVTSALTGLAPRAARKKTAEFQGALLDSVIDEGDVTVRAFEEAFDPCDLVVYGPADEIWQAFVERMPWGEDTAVHQELVAWLLDALLADHSSLDGVTRRPILTALDARTSIEGRVWHTRMPLEIRVAVDEARFQKERERPGEPFHAESDLSIAVSATIAASIPLRDLQPIFTTAERQMGLSRAPLRAEAPKGEPAPRKTPEVSPAPKAADPAPTAAPARTSVAPPPRSVAPPPVSAAPAPAPARTSVAPPPRSVAPPPPASVPPQPLPRDLAPPPVSKPGKIDAATRLESPTKPSARISIPDSFHDIPGEEERTNPWDIPTDATPDKAP
jgi:hypothetical protein